MHHYLLIARFTMDDIPLRLYDAHDCATAEADAKAIHADPTLLSTKWKSSVDKWPGLPVSWPCGFVGAIVLSISGRDGYPSEVTFDSTAEAVPAPPKTTPPEPAHPPVPEGHIEITDLNHRLRPHVDFVLSKYIRVDEWVPITGSDAVLISEWSEPGYRFCCLADRHPDLQGESAETPTREQLQAVVRSLEQSNSDLRAEFEQWRAHADTRIGELMTENSNLHFQLREQSQSAIRRNESDQQAFEFLQSQNSDLRRLNEDLNNRLSKTLARAALATHLESKVRASGIQLLRFSVAMGDRRRWATTFVEEGVLAKPYLQAIERIDEQFTELLHEFVDRFPHIQPDLPDEWQMRFDDAGNAAGNAAAADNATAADDNDA